MRERERGRERVEGVDPRRADTRLPSSLRSADRFSTAFVDPAARPGPGRDAARAAAAAAARRASGFVTGFDPTTAEERARAAARAARFGEATARPYEPVRVRAPEEEEARRRRAARFGVDHKPADATGLMDVDLLSGPKDAPADAVRRPEAVHVHGVDLLSTSDCLRYFSDWAPSFVEWIDDSSCNVVFSDAVAAKRAIVGRGAPIPPVDGAGEGARDEGGAGAATLPPSHPPPPSSAAIDPDTAPTTLWHKGDPFDKGGGALVPLLFRLATSADVKPAAPGVSRRLWTAGRDGRRGGGERREGGVAKKRAPRRRRARGSDGDAAMADAGGDE